MGLLHVRDRVRDLPPTVAEQDMMHHYEREPREFLSMKLF